MADGENRASFPATASLQESPSQGRSQRTPSTAQDQARSQTPRNGRHRKNKSQTAAQLDGTVSDSVTNPMTSNSRAKRVSAKQRQQSVATGMAPNSIGHVGKVQEHRQRPASMGGNALLPATPQREQAYAGPTFQASPAPSSLPVPKFFSRSVPNVAQNPLDARTAGEKPVDKEQSSPESDVVLPQPQPPNRATQQSPLDLFFKAQAAENERSASARILSPELATRQTPRPEQWTQVQSPANGLFLPQANGQPRSTAGQSFPAQAGPQAFTNQSTPPKNDQREAYTKSLKDLLFNEANASTIGPPTSPQTHRQATPESSRTYDAPFHTPSPSQRSVSGPSTPTPTAEQNHYTLHYGNRNLSPLFKTAGRAETPSRPSNLRQQSSASDSPLGGDISSVQPGSVDANSWSRSYLDQQIQASQPTNLPPLPFSHNQNSAASAPPLHQNQQQRGVQANGSGSGASPRTAPPANGGVDARALRNMEDDLRRMLKVNVLGN